MKPKPLPSAEYLRATFRYDPKTGLLYWRRRADVGPTWNSRHAGQVAGTIGFRGIKINIRDFGGLYAHRIIWKMTYGWDPEVVDHSDRNPFNNRLANLRHATNAENVCNQQRRPGRSGVRGVCREGKRWRVRIYVGGRRIEVGRYDDPADAEEAYRRAANDYHGEFVPAQRKAALPRWRDLAARIKAAVSEE